jgi:ribosome-associated translation inhibitor RaiA
LLKKNPATCGILFISRKRYNKHMRTIIKVTNMRLSSVLEAHLEGTVIRSLERLIGKSHTAGARLTLDIGKSTRHHKKGLIWRATGNLAVPGRVLRAKAEGERAQEAVDLLRSELERELKVYKGKRKTTALKGARHAKEQATIARAAQI